MKFFKTYTGPESVSIVNALVAIGENSSYANRKLIAAANGITDYSGTAAQNLKMLSLLKDGILIKPGTDATTDAATKQGNIRNFVVGGLIIAAVVAFGKMLFGNEPTKTATKKTQRSRRKTAKA